MSDVMQGPGWWLASDGKWYAPEFRTQVDDTLVHPEGADEPMGEGWWLASDGKWYSPALATETTETTETTEVVSDLVEHESTPKPASTPRALEPEQKPVEAATTKTPFTAPAIPEPEAKTSAPSPLIRKTEKKPVEKHEPHDTAAAMHYVGFVPEPGDLPEIRPELKVPFARPAGTEDSSEPSESVPAARTEEPESSDREPSRNGHDKDLLDTLDDTDMTPASSRGRKRGLFGRRS